MRHGWWVQPGDDPGKVPVMRWYREWILLHEDGQVERIGTVE